MQATNKQASVQDDSVQDDDHGLSLQTKLRKQFKAIEELKEKKKILEDVLKEAEEQNDVIQEILEEMDEKKAIKKRKCP